MKPSDLKFLVTEALIQSLNESRADLKEGDDKYEFEQGKKWAIKHRTQGMGPKGGLEYLLQRFPGLSPSFKKGYNVGHGVSMWNTFNGKLTDFLGRFGSGNVKR